MGTIAIAVFDFSLEWQLYTMPASVEVRHAVESMLGSLAVATPSAGLGEASAEIAQRVAARVLFESFRLVVLIAAGAALAAALTAGLTIRGGGAETDQRRPLPV